MVATIAFVVILFSSFQQAVPSQDCGLVGIIFGCDNSSYYDYESNRVDAEKELQLQKMNNDAGQERERLQSELQQQLKILDNQSAITLQQLENNAIETQAQRDVKIADGQNSTSIVLEKYRTDRDIAISENQLAATTGIAAWKTIEAILPTLGVIVAIVIIAIVAFKFMFLREKEKTERHRLLLSADLVKARAALADGAARNGNSVMLVDNGAYIMLPGGRKMLVSNDQIVTKYLEMKDE